MCAPFRSRDKEITVLNRKLAVLLCSCISGCVRHTESSELGFECTHPNQEPFSRKKIQKTAFYKRKTLRKVGQQTGFTRDASRALRSQGPKDMSVSSFAFFCVQRSLSDSAMQKPAAHTV